MLPNRRNLRRWVTVLAALAILPACRETTPKNTLVCKRIENTFEMIGGPASIAQVGDYILRNDKIQIVVTQKSHSWGPGIFGGALVDADLRRVDARFRNGNGLDSFMEMFPLANLVVPNSDAMRITVVSDGSDGKEARLRVESDGTFLFSFLNLLNGPGISSLVNVNFAMRTDYVLRPGTRHVEMETTLLLPVKEPDTCPEFKCELKCEFGYKVAETKCRMCQCEEPLLMSPLTEPVGVFERITGDLTTQGDKKPGILGGDFLFFGGQNDIFAPGIGFDEDKEIWDGFYRGVSSLSRPLTFEFVAAEGEFTSYGLVVKREKPKPTNCTSRLVLGWLAPANRDAVKAALVQHKGMSDADAEKALTDLLVGKIPLRLEEGLAAGDVSGKKLSWEERFAGSDFRLRAEEEGECGSPKIQFPLFTTSSTATLAAGINCSKKPDDDADCDRRVAFQYRRYFVIGAGDVGSIYDEIIRIRGAEYGTIRGVVLQGETRFPVSGAKVFLIKNPDPQKTWSTYEELVAENIKSFGTAGIVNAYKTDVGTDPIKDGDFQGMMTPGDYLVMARSPEGTRSPLYPVTITPGSAMVVNPVITSVARVSYRVMDDNGNRIPAKLVFVALDASGNPLYRDGKRLVALGDSRYNDGIRYKFYTHDGEGTVTIEPGRYRIYVSHGLEYSINVRDLVAVAGKQHKIESTLRREVDTRGWISADFHVHSRKSFDSGLTLTKRITTYLAEGVEFLSSSDHDISTNYEPVIKELKAERWLKTVVGVELTTIETGHYLGFPLNYSDFDIPGHGAVDWVGMDIPQVLKTLRSRGLFGPDLTVAVVPHPRDGFNGYFDQMGLNSYTLERKPTSLEADNPCWKRVSCNFNAIEIINEKRFELIRNPTVGEVNDYNRALLVIDAASDPQDVPFCQGKALGLEGCKEQARLDLNGRAVLKMLERTPEEQQALANFIANTPNEKTRCDAAAINGPRLSDEERNKPCTLHPGHLDDWFNLLNHGMHVTALGNSDSHDTLYEAGFPRNYVRSSTDRPDQINVKEITKNIIGHRVQTTTGPFIDFTINDGQVGETVTATGNKLKLHVKVQTASWLAANRVEIYRNGLLIKVLTANPDKAQIVDFDEQIELDTPGEDSWFVVVAMGNSEAHFLRPLYVTAPFGLLQIPKLIELTAATFPLLNIVLGGGGADPVVPDFFPMIPYALTNPIFVDVDGNGYQSPKQGPPPFCPKACTLPEPVNGEIPEQQQECPDGMVCQKGVEGTGVCGIAIDGSCFVDENDSLQSVEQGLSLNRSINNLTQRQQLWNAFRRSMRSRSRKARVLKSLLGHTH